MQSCVGGPHFPTPVLIGATNSWNEKKRGTAKAQKREDHAKKFSKGFFTVEKCVL